MVAAASASLDDFNLFGDDIPSGGSLHVGPDKHVRLAHRAWKSWCEVTQRPDARQPDARFVAAYVERLRAHYKNEFLMRVVMGAARLEVYPRDMLDVRRVVSALRSENKARAAVALLSTNRPVVLYPSTDDASMKCTIEDIERACRLSVAHWSERDLEAAGSLMVSLTADEVEAAAAKAAQSLASDAVMPVEVLRAANSKSKPATRSGSGARRTYAAGVVERDQMRDIEFELDDMASKARLRGDSPDAIRALHFAVPSGYWDAVYDQVAQGKTNAEAYEALRERFSFHPEDRR